MKIFQTFLVLCSLTPLQFFATYHSQCEQDKFVNEAFFKNRKNGVFLDVGAHDGVTFSNTYFFEQELGWKGICLEPMPDVFEVLKKNRKAICICACAHTEHNVYKDFARIKGSKEMLSGLLEKFNPGKWEKVQRQIKSSGESFEIIKVLCCNLNKILEEQKISHVNFMSLDTEGGELEILKSIDFSKVQIDVITVEDNFKDPRFITFLESQGFKFMTALKWDKVFVNTKAGIL